MKNTVIFYLIKVDSSDDDIDVDEHSDYKISQLNNDFYTSSICEGPPTERGINLINNLPKPFVKQATLIPTASCKNIHSNLTSRNLTIKHFINIPSEREIQNRLQIEDTLIRFLLSARNGDKDSFIKHLNL